MSDAAAEREFLRRYLTCGVHTALYNRDFDALLRMIPYGVDIQKNLRADSATWHDFIRSKIRAADETFYNNMHKLLVHGIDPGAGCLNRIFENRVYRERDYYRCEGYGERLYYKLKIIKLLYAFGTCWSATPGVNFYEVVSEFETLEGIHILISNGVEPNINFEKCDSSSMHELVVASKYRSYSYGLHMIKLLLEAGSEIFNLRSTTPNEFTRRIYAKWNGRSLNSGMMNLYKRFNLLKLFYGANYQVYEKKIMYLEATLILNVLIENVF